MNLCYLILKRDNKCHQEVVFEKEQSAVKAAVNRGFFPMELCPCNLYKLSILTIIIQIHKVEGSQFFQWLYISLNLFMDNL